MRPSSLLLAATLTIHGTYARPLPSLLGDIENFFGSGDDESSGSTTPVSLATANATLLRAGQFARAAYCSPESVTAWNCGLPCTQLAGVQFLQSGGNQGTVPFYYIAHDTVENTLVVSHEGTDPDNLLSLLNDAEFALTDVDAQRITLAAGQGAQVHDGFQDTFQRTADGILSGVQAALGNDSSISQVLVTGHSLGAALATMTAAMLRSNLPSNIDITTTTFGLPRGGNQAWADFLDSQSPVTFVTNQNDPVPIVPPLAFGYKHSSGEVHITDPTTPAIVSCPGQDNSNCITGNSLLDASVANHLGPYFSDLTFGSGQCSS
uniref:Fungal lipase-type domain-containing protein n=1 Tax=Mycena chlorophos TaxID=658473 RepID=A0ABQ0LGZ6_MYCCL|nr:predicted protein [Mycena chlorophos]